MTVVERALMIAQEVHKGQTTKWTWEPYIEHCRAVAAMVHPYGETKEAAALLHDVVEDGIITPFMKLHGIEKDSILEPEQIALLEEKISARLTQLQRAGIPKEVTRLVNILSRRPNETYKKYIERVSKDPDAIIIKQADLTHNSLQSRNPAGSSLTINDVVRLAKYKQSLRFLAKVQARRQRHHKRGPSYGGGAGQNRPRNGGR